jgi:hypothetical protein
LLEREAELLVAREAELESLVNVQKASLELRQSEGSLMLRYGIEAMEVENP